jgi:hypothetical protein
MSEHNYSVRCWINGSMSTLAVAVDLKEKDLVFTMEYAFAEGMDSFTAVVQKGKFNKLCQPNKYDSAPFPYSDIESIVGKLYEVSRNSFRLIQRVDDTYSESLKANNGFRIELVCLDRARGTKLNIEMVADRAYCEDDPDKTRDLFNRLIQNCQHLKRS